MFETERAIIDNRLNEIVSKYTEIKEAASYALFTGGKRLRPLLVLLTLKDLNIDIKKGLDISCAIEMIHAYSLVHDDLPAMDNDDLRRGKPTNHIVYGENVAILVGDALLTESFNVIANSNIESNKIIEIIKVISSLAGANGMIRGQYLDLKSDVRTMDDINLIHDHKTKDLIEASLLSAAIIADENLEDYKKIAYFLGKAFQIKDDLDDIDKQETSTILRLIGYEKSHSLLVEYRIRCLNLIENIIGRKDLYKLVELIIWC